jgi:hypothetical protein
MLMAAPNIQICARHVLTGTEAISAPNGGTARVLQNFSITQCDEVCKLAVVPAGRGRSRPALNGRVHASGACAWARLPGSARPEAGKSALG